MRLFAYSLMVFCCVASFAVADDDAAPTTDQASNVADETVTVDGRELKLAYEGEAGGDTIQEFIPTDETLETWTRLAAVREYPELNNPLEVAQAVIKQLEERNPPANHELMQNPKNGDVVLNFIVWPDDGSFAEFNVFQYHKHQGGGLVSYQYAARAYGDQAETFIKSLDSDARTMFLLDTLEFAVSQGKRSAAQDEPAEGNGPQVLHFVPINPKGGDETSSAATDSDAANSDAQSTDDESN